MGSHPPSIWTLFRNHLKLEGSQPGWNEVRSAFSNSSFHWLKRPIPLARKNYTTSFKQMATVATPIRILLSWSLTNRHLLGELCHLTFSTVQLLDLSFWMDWKRDQNSNDLPEKNGWQIFGDLEDRAPRLGKRLITMISCKSPKYGKVVPLPTGHENGL